jgi:glycosyltransferase involved in cell wall biosynthesis
MKPWVSILIATLNSRQNLVNPLLARLWGQIGLLPVEIICFADGGQLTLGEKRNKMISDAKGDYICCLDDDDGISDEYIRSIMTAATSGCDCASLVGRHYIDGIFQKPFYHSIDYDSWWEDKTAYYRCPNHLNLIKREHVVDIKFRGRDYVRGMDAEWSMAIQCSGRLKNEFKIDRILYHYYAKSNPEK